MRSDAPIFVTNKLMFLNKCCTADAVAVSMSGLITEYEVKVSRADFVRDRHKKRFAIYSGEMPGRVPNFFFYATAPGIIDERDLPAWAGWLEYVNGAFIERRPAPRTPAPKHPNAVLLQLARAMRRRPISP